MQERIPAVLMRGGTSKGLFFHARHLPSDMDARKNVILRAYGSPDPTRRQTDGLGGGNRRHEQGRRHRAFRRPPPTTSNTTSGRSPSTVPMWSSTGDAGTFRRQWVRSPWTKGLSGPSKPVTTVRILQKNAGKLIIAEVSVRDGCFDEQGDFAVAGVPGTGSRIVLRYVDPGGAVTGKLFPTGNRCDELRAGPLGTVPVTIMDAANPVVFVQAATVGLSGAEIDEIDADAGIRWKLETIRTHAAVLMGLAATPEEANFSVQSIPKMAVVAPAKTYRTTSGTTVEGSQFDFLARVMVMGTLHRNYGMTTAICTAGAAAVEGTVVHELLGGPVLEERVLKLGHPGGTTEIGVVLEKEIGEWTYREAVVSRTARRLMEGHVLVPRRRRGGS